MATLHFLVGLLLNTFPIVGETTTGLKFLRFPKKVRDSSCGLLLLNGRLADRKTGTILGRILAGHSRFLNRPIWKIFCNFAPNPVLNLKAMENNPSNLREALWRRKLSDAKRAELCSQPELELEARLTEAITKIPDASVPSNFTARVLAAVELEDNKATRSRGWNWRLLWPRVAVAAAVLIFAGVSLQHYEVKARRAELAENLASVTRMQTPSIEALENLDAIQRMSQSQTGHADTELLADLQ